MRLGNHIRRHRRGRAWEVCTTGASLTEKCRNIPALVNQLPSDICHWAELGTGHPDPPGSTRTHLDSSGLRHWHRPTVPGELPEGPKTMWLANAGNILTFCIAKVLICSYEQATPCLSSWAGHIIYIYTHMCIYIYRYLWLYTYIYVYIYIYVCIYTQYNTILWYNTIQYNTVWYDII